MALTNLAGEQAFATLRARAGQADGQPHWPEESWHALHQLGALAWSIPTAYGGDGLQGFALLERYEALASACLTSAFILSQREAACRRVLEYGSATLLSELLPPLVAGSAFATVGLSHLTTSRQHLRPALTASMEGDRLILNGMMPWVTGAARADFLVTGAVLDGGQQMLMVVPRQCPGLEVPPPLDLMALEGSITAEVHCRRVALDRKWILAGPTDRVLSSGRGGTGGLETSALALGLARAAVDFLVAEAHKRPELLPNAESLQTAHDTLRAEIQQACNQAPSAERLTSIRGQANALVLRATQAALTASKGTGFLRSHPAQRWARQALFFLVWSCPWPAAQATLAQLIPSDIACS